MLGRPMTYQKLFWIVLKVLLVTDWNYFVNVLWLNMSATVLVHNTFRDLVSFLQQCVMSTKCMIAVYDWRDSSGSVDNNINLNSQFLYSDPRKSNTYLRICFDNFCCCLSQYLCRMNYATGNTLALLLSWVTFSWIRIEKLNLM